MIDVGDNGNMATLPEKEAVLEVDTTSRIRLSKDIDDNRYEVGLLWKSESRPQAQDNKKQAVSQAIALRMRLVKENTLDA